MKTTVEKIAIMQAFEDGEIIETNNAQLQGDWWENNSPDWDWGRCYYRIKPKEPAIDWSKVAIDTPVLVKMHNSKDDWTPRYFNRPDLNGYLCFNTGETSRTADNSSSWDEIRLDLEAKSIINWIPNTGAKPDYDHILIKNKCGGIALDDSDRYEWGINHQDCCVSFYAIIE